MFAYNMKFIIRILHNMIRRYFILGDFDLQTAVVCAAIYVLITGSRLLEALCML